MYSIELIPDMNHCIETVTRNKYSELARELLTCGEACTERQDKLEMLRFFLDTADFRQLRADSEKHLLKGKKVIFTVYFECTIPRYDMTVI